MLIRLGQGSSAWQSRGDLSTAPRGHILLRAGGSVPLPHTLDPCPVPVLTESSGNRLVSGESCPGPGPGRGLVAVSSCSVVGSSVFQDGPVGVHAGAGSWARDASALAGRCRTNTDRALLPACGSGREHQARAWFCPLRSSRDHVPDPSLSKGVGSPSWEVCTRVWRGVYFGRGLQRSPWRECCGRNPGLPRALRPSLPTGTLAPSLVMPRGWLWVPIIASPSSEPALSRRGIHGSHHFLFLVVFGAPTRTLSRCWGHRRAAALRCGVRLGGWGAGDGGRVLILSLVPSPGGSARSGLRPGLVFGAWGTWPQGRGEQPSAVFRKPGQFSQDLSLPTSWDADSRGWITGRLGEGQRNQDLAREAGSRVASGPSCLGLAVTS